MDKLFNITIIIIKDQFNKNLLGIDQTKHAAL